jgi:hypothetical protein
VSPIPEDHTASRHLQREFERIGYDPREAERLGLQVGMPAAEALRRLKHSASLWDRACLSIRDLRRRRRREP